MRFYDRVDFIKISMLSIALLVALLLCGGYSIRSHNENLILKNENSIQLKEIESLNETVDQMLDKRIENMIELAYYHTNVVFFMRAGGSYHRYDCHFRKSADSYYTANVEMAKNLFGCRPCSVCEPVTK